MSAPALERIPPAFAGRLGAARRDTTPPLGIYARMWGAAAHDRAAGIHRPLTTTVLVLQSREGGPLRALVGLDLCMLGDAGNPADAERALGPLRRALDLDEGRLIVNCSHTHAGPFTATSRGGLPGGDLIGPYLDQLGEAVRDAGLEARDRLEPAILTWASGRCDLATNRDLPDPGSERIFCGYNPRAQADDTLLVGRATAAEGRVIATIVNYACHPTTLAWENTLLSPDYVGAMRELVESQTGAPCLFLQGASGELGPAYQYVGDPEIADTHGRRLGFSALAAIAGMLPHGQALAYERLVESGAPLAIWRPRPFEPSAVLEGGVIGVPLALKPLPSPGELEAQLAATSDRVVAERLRRKARIAAALGEGERQPSTAWVWRLGQSLLVAHPNEAYSRFQLDLRAAFPEQAVVVMNTSGPELGYLYPPELERLDLYQVWQSPFAGGALQTLTESCIAEGTRLIADG